MHLVCFLHLVSLRMVDSRWYVDVTNLVYFGNSTVLLFPTNHILSHMIMIPHDGM